MRFLLFINLSIIFFIAVFIFQKRLPVLLNIFNFFVIEFLITSLFGALGINYKFWETSTDIQLQILLRVFEIIIAPLLYILYFNQLYTAKSLISKGVLTLLLLGIFWGFELLFVKWGVFIFKDWSYGKALFMYLLILLFSYFLQKGFTFVLRKEGIETK